MIIIENQGRLSDLLGQEMGGVLRDEELTSLGLDQFLQLDLKRRSELLIIDIHILKGQEKKWEDFKCSMNSYIGALFFSTQKDEHLEAWIKNEISLCPKVLGYFSYPLEGVENIILENQINFFQDFIQDQRKLQTQIVSFSSELNEVIENAEIEMNRAKALFEHIVPKRSEEIKGFYFTNKYLTGSGGGVEFYDLIQSGNKLFQLIISTQSYLLSSSLLGLISASKETGFDAQSFIVQAQKELQAVNQSKKKLISLDICLLEIDINLQTLRALHSTQAQFYNSEGDQVLLPAGEIKELKKGDQIWVFSPGLVYNWEKANNAHQFKQVFLENKTSNRQELLSEIFFKLKEINNPHPLERDSIGLMLEVKKHGIYKV